MQGKLITFEGLDGCGKTTQRDRLSMHFINPYITRQPGGSALGASIREILLNYEKPVVPMAELLLLAADRAQHSVDIETAIHNGRTVLCDRYTDSTVAYQSCGRKLPLEFIETVNTVATGGRKPDLTLWIDTLIKDCMKRMRGDRMSGDYAFYEDVRMGYCAIAALEPGRMVRIDGDGTIDEVGDRIVKVVSESFPDLFDLD